MNTLPAVFVALLATLASSVPALANPTQQKKSSLEKQKNELRTELKKLEKKLADTKASHTEAADALASSEKGISAANRKLRALAKARQAAQAQLDQIHARQTQVSAQQSDAQRELTALLQVHTALARTQPWQRMIEGTHPAQLEREQIYLKYLTYARADTLATLEARSQTLAALSIEAKDKREELAAIAAQEHTHRAQLLKQKEDRQKVLTQLARQIKTQRRSIAHLQRNDKRLSELIDRLSRQLAEQAKKRREQAAQRAKQAKPPPPPSTSYAQTQFGRQQGQLTMPVTGTVAARFGAAREVEGAGRAPTWKGIFIQADAGAPVQAVAKGEVVFSDWLRGFGNLMILDHGEGFLTVYGNNESLLQSVGEHVAAGQVIASVGNTGGNSSAGLYFEIRFNGRPIDPLRWVKTR